MSEILNQSNRAELAEFEAFNLAHPKGHFCQSEIWGGVKNEWERRVIVSRDEQGNLRGGMALLIRKMPGMPWTMLYSPRGPVCDPHDEATIRDLCDGARRLAAEKKGFTIKLDPDILSSDQTFTDLMKRQGFALHSEGKNFEGIQPRYVFRLDVAGKTEEELLKGFHEKWRYNIRLAGRKGVTVRICGKEMLPDFYRIMVETGMRDNFVTRPLSYFERMMDSMGDHLRLYMAFFEDQPIAGTLAIHYGDKVWYLYGASSNAHRNVMPNYLLQWEMIRWAVAEGCRVYDFRGVSGDLSEDNPLYGLYRFKKGFGGDFTEFAGEFELLLKPGAAKMIERLRKVYNRTMSAIYRFKNRGSAKKD
ncbi:MAG: peptidoglycan bridge formation glycyltransferase FemA/FemB family protein [Clostridia bacterium]|nr:peptidoglycan bridge formation glycyltransferase FemA/FemB family protein [Clostridia bacterium]MBQ3076829.1 peptidoglycan bridge formation glycyltransferase FemA/FemB family protein [Clostridia bacterium]